MNIFTVSSKWKKSGARIISKPFKRYNNWIIYDFLFIKNWVSSLPKWKAATDRKIKSVAAGNSNQIKMTISATKI